jgi:hypothetical protein
MVFIIFLKDKLFPVSPTYFSRAIVIEGVLG